MTKPTILIVEDEPSIAENIQFGFQRSGFETLWLAEGQTVLERLESEPIDLLILDIGLPDMDGTELCKQIRQDHSLPIIFLTARDEEIDRVVGLEIGADDYVTKPFSVRELVARVKAILRRIPPSSTTSMNEASNHAPASSQPKLFVVDAEKYRIHYSGHLLELSHHEYRLLHTLIQRPGQVFTRERLLDKVCGEDEIRMDRVIDAHVKNVRKKLRTVRGDLDPIETHRGIGYSLRDDL